MENRPAQPRRRGLTAAKKSPFGFEAGQPRVALVVRKGHDPDETAGRGGTQEGWPRGVIREEPILRFRDGPYSGHQKIRKKRRGSSPAGAWGPGFRRPRGVSECPGPRDSARPPSPRSAKGRAGLEETPRFFGVGESLRPF